MLEQLSSLSKSNSDSREILFGSRSYGYCSISTPNFGAKRRLRLLAEFLQGRCARQQMSAEQETASQDSEIEIQNQVTVLSDDLLFKILILLPAESLFRLQFVCKKWFSLINSSIFINSHSQQSETVLLCQKLTILEPGNPAALQPVEQQGFIDKPKSYFHLLDLNHGGNNFMESSIVESVSIRASYNGLILATIEKSKSLILMNPVTEKHIVLPSSIRREFYFESFGIAFCDDVKMYIVVHLFREDRVSLGCEILHISTRKWTRIEGPPSGVFVVMGKTAASISGSLYWISAELGGCDYFISMNVQDEKFITKKLPVRSLLRDELLEIGGNLGFFSYWERDLLQVWVLITHGGSEENWTKKYSINLNVYASLPDPICCSRNGEEMVVEMMHELYVYSFEAGEMKLIQSTSDDGESFQRVFNEYIPHRNTLASWEDHLEVLC